jgi:osmotically-inducible protein OsmY
MSRQANFVSGMIVGAGLMYMLDPGRGARRRALLRDQVVHGAHELEDAGERLVGRSEHMRNRVRGAMANARARRRPEVVDDSVLEARVLSEIGRAVSNPGAIDVAARAGRVTLSGPVLEDEAEKLLASVGSVRGVEEVENRLDVHAEAGAVAGLQGTSS